MPSKVISIEIGLIKTRICEVDYRKKSPQVYRYISFDTPKNSYEDGYIRDKDALVAIIREKIRESGIKSDTVVFSLSSTKLVNREVIIPFIKEERIKDVVKANAGEYFPVDISEYVVTYTLLDRFTNDKEKKLRLLVLAAPDIMVKTYYDLAQTLGYHVGSIDYMGNSTYQLVKKSVGSDSSMIVHLSEHTTFINIVDNGVLSLPRTITYGIMNIVDTIVDSKNIIISNQEDAHRFLYTQCLIGRERNRALEEAAISSQMMRVDYFNEEKKDALREEITDSLQYLINNISRILDYYSRNQEKKINTLYIIGQATNLIGLKEYLWHELGVEVKSIDTLNSIMFSRYVQITSRESGDLIACVGASINPVEFIPRDYLELSIKKGNIHSIVFALAAGTVLSLALILLSYLSYKNELNKNKDLKNDIAELSLVNQIYDEYDKAKELLEKANSIYAMTSSPTENFTDLLSEIERKLPSKAVVDTINVTTEGITFSFTADSEITAAKVLQQLKTIPTLTLISTNAIDASEDNNGVVEAKFTVVTMFVKEVPKEVKE